MMVIRVIKYIYICITECVCDYFSMLIRPSVVEIILILLNYYIKLYYRASGISVTNTKGGDDDYLFWCRDVTKLLSY